MTTAETKRPDTIVLIHGLWMTARSWERWVPFYEAKGFKVLTPTYPGMEVEVEALRKDSSPIAALSVEKVANHLDAFVRALPSKPILMGHSFGGTMVQVLLDRGLGAAGVAIDSAPVRGIFTIPFTQLRATFPVMKNPANRTRAVPLTPKEFRYAFTNSLDEATAQAIYERYAVAAPGRVVFESVSANFDSKSAAKVDFDKPDRAPLFFIAGGADNIMPPAVNRSNAKKYRSGVVGYREFEGRDHSTAGAPGWEAVATAALDWALDPKPMER